MAGLARSVPSMFGMGHTIDRRLLSEAKKKCQFDVSDLKPNVPISKPTFFSQGKYFLAIF
jgi:hypothetical protein